MQRLPVAVIGAGLIGRTHIDRALRHPDVALVGIADPASDGEQVARSVGVPWFADYRQMIDVLKPHGVVVATPNVTHARIAVDCLERGIPVVVEKPIAHTLEDARSICSASERTGLPVLVGHHRRYNPITRRAKDILVSGRLGKPVAATVLCTWLKADDYFKAAWRREKGAGPVLNNLIHDIDLLRFLFGEVESVQAIASNAIRGFEVEDTCVVICRFCNGALGAITVSDTAVGPWNWDLTAGEADLSPQQHVDAYFLSGTHASLTLPRLEIWEYRTGRGWRDPLTVEQTPLRRGCPYSAQWRHFRALIEGKEGPLCSALDGTRTLEATLAITASAAAGLPVVLVH